MESDINTVFCESACDQSDPPFHSRGEPAERGRTSRGSRGSRGSSTGVRASPASHEIQNLRSSSSSGRSRTRRTGRERNTHRDGSMWSRDWHVPRAGRLLPAHEEVFLRDMLSDNPRYRSISQLKPMEYWERAAATLPDYEGPYQPPPPPPPALNQ